MMPDSNLSGLHQRLARALAAGHAKPPPPRAIELRDQEGAPFTLAAVLIAVTERPANPGVLLIHRPGHMRRHAGQVALPGGRLEAGEDAVAGALREAEEELGIAASVVRVIGATDRLRTGTRYEITPVLATIPPDLALRPDPGEVKSWFEAPLAHLLDRSRHSWHDNPSDYGPARYTEMRWEEHRIWGITAAILANLAYRLDWEPQSG